MEKSPDAFRTISEVADWLDIPTHVLRFWESRFSQIKPVKRAGGRRYYRPSDMRLIGGVKVLLHDQGMTIRAVQKLLREEGIKHVSGFSQPLDTDSDDGDDVIDAVAVEETVEAPMEPAMAARGTREAEPDPLEDIAAEPEPEAPDPAEAKPTDETADEPVMFRRSTPRFTPTAEAAPEPEREAPLPKIPATPDVPDTDPDDDDPAFAADISTAARIATMPPAQLARQGAALRDLRDRLADIRARLG